ncbi:hypothetical protein L596_016922 [Steinernema carpocapsae]|uniref:Secreted protein n=1 Tax=Steinernema carpocapsae TaxID=34508 RepID=A0A4U5NKN8_STECR|nr:hypothetical protein L596_016922 [Steinernema carpocapsae]
MYACFIIGSLKLAAVLYTIVKNVRVCSNVWLCCMSRFWYFQKTIMKMPKPKPSATAALFHLLRCGITMPKIASRVDYLELLHCHTELRSKNLQNLHDPVTYCYRN